MRCAGIGVTHSGRQINYNFARRMPFVDEVSDIIHSIGCASIMEAKVVEIRVLLPDLF